VSKPPVEMVATDVSELDQHTVFPLQLVPPVNVDVLVSWKVPVAVSCWVAPWLILGVGGSIVMVVRVGFWKKPLQLMVSAAVSSMAQVSARRSLCFVDDIVISDRRSRPALILLARRCA